MEAPAITAEASLAGPDTAFAPIEPIQFHQRTMFGYMATEDQEIEVSLSREWQDKGFSRTAAHSPTIEEQHVHTVLAFMQKENELKRR